MSGTNGYQTVKSWRDEVSNTLGRLDERTLNMQKDMQEFCSQQEKNSARINELEEIESNRGAVNKKVAVIYGAIITFVTAIANIAWKIFK